jgi:hypothetical protein
MKTWLPTLAFLLAVVCICGMAMRATGRDNDCAARGGHLEGLIRMECVR